MALSLLLAFQASAAPPQVPAQVPASEPIAPVDFDLARPGPQEFDLDVTGARACARRAADEIVICGVRARDGGYPVEEMAELFEAGPLIARIDLGGGATARVVAESVTLDRGAISNRAMVRVKVPF